MGLFFFIMVMVIKYSIAITLYQKKDVFSTTMISTDAAFSLPIFLDQYQCFHFSQIKISCWVERT